MPALILLNLKSIKHQRECDDEHDLDISCFYCIKAIWILPDYLQWTLYVKTKSHVYMCIKKLAKNYPGLVIPHQVNNKVYLSYL